MCLGAKGDVNPGNTASDERHCHGDYLCAAQRLQRCGQAVHMRSVDQVVKGEQMILGNRTADLDGDAAAGAAATGGTMSADLAQWHFELTSTPCLCSQHKAQLQNIEAR
mmetsp:Transcript_44395/g.105159  ORF Transcript_44395/g.105159 Transcript_44395/m.105159 type:complete len:109 (-) Transcript_44395:269-595(-)